MHTLFAFTSPGDHGREILELLRKNPAGAIPTIVQRMKAKDMEWRRVRAELRKGWNEVLHKHYYKALDYQSNTFRQVRSVCLSVHIHYSKVHIVVVVISYSS